MSRLHGHVDFVPAGDLERWLREPSCEDVTLEHRYLKLMSQLRRAIDRPGEPARMATLAKSVENRLGPNALVS
jgi:hypothetical protein